MHDYSSPWRSEKTSTVGHYAIFDSEGYTVCEPSPMGAANARLITHAPDLLEALQQAYKAMVHAELSNSNRKQWDDAINNAHLVINRVIGG